VEQVFYGLSRDNLYQIRKRLTEKLRETVAEVIAEMDAPMRPALGLDRVLDYRNAANMTKCTCQISRPLPYIIMLLLSVRQSKVRIGLRA